MLRRVMMGAGAAPTGWVEVASFSPATVSDGWSGYTFRQPVKDSDLSGATKLRVTLRCATGKSLNISSAYLGNKGGLFAYSFASTPVQVFFGGSPSLSVSGLVDTVSDEVNLTVSGTEVILSLYFNTTTSLPYNVSGGLGESPYFGYYKLGDDASTVAATGYDSLTGSALLVKVEKYIA